MRSPAPFPAHIPLRDAQGNLVRAVSDTRLWELVPFPWHVRSQPRLTPWLRALEYPVHFLLVSEPLPASRIHPLGPNTPTTHLPDHWQDLSRSLAQQGVFARKLVLALPASAPPAEEEALSLLGMEARPMSPDEAARLLRRVLSGVDQENLPLSPPSHIHLGDRPLTLPWIPLSSAPVRRRSASSVARPDGFPSLPSEDTLFHSGVRTVRHMALPDFMRVYPQALESEGIFTSMVLVDGLPREIPAQALTSTLQGTGFVDVSLRLTPLDTDLVLRYLNRRIRDLQSSSFSRPGIEDYRAKQAMQDADALRQALFLGNTRLFRIHLSLAVRATDMQELRHKTRNLIHRLRQAGFSARLAIFRQWEGVVSLLPGQPERLGGGQNVTLEAAERLLPLPLAGRTPSGILLGPSRDRGLVYVDRTRFLSPMAVYLGAPGSGKSTWAKVELWRWLASHPADRAVVVDPEGEYAALARELGGAELVLSSAASATLSPLDGAMDAEAHILPELLAGALGADDDRQRFAVRRAMQLLKPRPDATLSELAKHLPPPWNMRLEELLEGPLQALAGPSRVDPQARVLLLNVKGMDPALLSRILPLFTHVALRHVRSNAGEGWVWLTMDEFHLYLGHPHGTRWLVQLAKRARKRGIAITALTQHVSDFLQHPESSTLLASADMVALFRPGLPLAPFSQVLGLGPEEEAELPGLQAGEALLLLPGARLWVQVALSPLEARVTDTRPVPARESAPFVGG